MVSANELTFLDFLTDERGVVTTDWMLFVASSVAFGMAVVLVVSGGVEDLSGETAEDVAAVPVVPPFGEDE